MTREHGIVLSGWLAAALLALAGAVLLASNLHTTPNRFRAMQRKLHDLNELTKLQNLWESRVACLETFERLSNKKPRDLRVLLKKSVPNSSFDSGKSERRPLLSGWTARRVTVTLQDAPLPAVGALLVEAESGRPPWRLTQGSLALSSAQPGHGRVALTLEALEKESP